MFADFSQHNGCCETNGIYQIINNKTKLIFDWLSLHINKDPYAFRYIVECSTDVEPPAYLNGSDTYDLSPIAEPFHKVNMGPFNCLDQGAWPTMEELGLDESQMKVTHWMQQKKTPRLHLIGFKQSIHTEVASVE